MSGSPSNNWNKPLNFMAGSWTPMGEIRSVVKQVLNQVGTSREARYYLNQYSEDSLHFAVIKVGGALIENQLESLARRAFLRNLGLMPIILHGAGPQLDAALASADVPTVKHEGLRVTTPEVMEIARPVIYRANRQIVTALENQGVRAQGIQHGVFDGSSTGRRWGWSATSAASTTRRATTRSGSGYCRWLPASPRAKPARS
jgi:hypothetical protein